MRTLTHPLPDPIEASPARENGDVVCGQDPCTTDAGCRVAELLASGTPDVLLRIGHGRVVCRQETRAARGPGWRNA